MMLVSFVINFELLLIEDDFNLALCVQYSFHIAQQIYHIGHRTENLRLSWYHLLNLFYV